MRRRTKATAALLLCALGMLLPLCSFAAVRGQAAPAFTGDAWDARFAAPVQFPQIRELVAGDGSLYYWHELLPGVIDRWDGTATHTIGLADGDIQGLAYAPGSLYATGSFTAISGVQAPGLARWDVATETWHRIDRRGKAICAILAAEHYIYTVAFAAENGSLAVERWDSIAQTWHSLATIPHFGGVADLITLNDSLYVSFNDSPVGVVRIDLTSNAWHSILDQEQSINFAELAASSSVLYLARAYYRSSAAIIEVFSYDDATEALRPLGNIAAQQGSIGTFDMLFAGGSLYIAGAIYQINNTPANGVVRWDGAGWDSPGAGPTPLDGSSLLFFGRSLVVDGQGIVVSGSFSDAARSIWEPGLARWAPASGTWEALAANPTALGVDGSISALVAAGSDLYVGGSFTYAGTTRARNLARLDTRTMTWHAIGAQNSVTALSVRNDTLYVGYSQRQGVEEINLRTGIRRSLGSAWLSCPPYGYCIGVRFLAATASGLYAADGGSLIHVTDTGASTLIGKTSSTSYNSSGPLFDTAYTADDQYVYSARQFSPHPSSCGVPSRATIVITRWKGAVGEELPGGVSGPVSWSFGSQGACFLSEKPFVYGLLADDDGLYVFGDFDQAGSTLANGWAYWSNQDGSWQSRLQHPPEASSPKLPQLTYIKVLMHRGNDGPVLVAPMAWVHNPFTPSLWEWRDGDWQKLGFGGSFGGPIASVGCDIYAGVGYASPPWPVQGSGLARIVRTCRAGGALRTTRGAPVAGVTLSAGAAQATTLSDGSYSFTGLPDGAATITPARDRFVFEPPTRSITFPTISARQDFTLLPAPVSAALIPGQPASLSYTDVNGLPVTLNVPPGATSASSLALAAAVPSQLPARLATTGHALEVRVNPEDAAPFAHGMTLTIAYSDAELRQLRGEAQLRLYRWDGQAWFENGATCPGDTRQDASANSFSATLCAPGRYMLAGPARGTALPLVVR